MNLCWVFVLIVLSYCSISTFFDFSSPGKLWIFISGTFTKGKFSEWSNLVLFWEVRLWKLVWPHEGEFPIASLLNPDTFQAHCKIKSQKKWFSVYLWLKTWNRDFFSSFCSIYNRNLKKSLDFKFEVEDTRRITFFPILCWNVPAMCSDYTKKHREACLLETKPIFRAGFLKNVPNLTTLRNFL